MSTPVSRTLSILEAVLQEGQGLSVPELRDEVIHRGGFTTPHELTVLLELLAARGLVHEVWTAHRVLRWQWVREAGP